MIIILVLHIQTVLGLCRIQCMSFCNYVTISHLFIFKKFHHFNVCIYVFYIFYYLFTISKVQELLSFFKITVSLHTAVYVLHVSDVGAYVGGF